ncbi:MAG: HD domain-containing protein [Cryomorphaceae bacterium]|nr:HD domain-containing protein [Cryomorphaceae bacterium]
MTELISICEAEMMAKFSDEGSGHDWFHILRVRNSAEKIAMAEGANVEITILAALLHDIDDHKFNGGDVYAGPIAAHNFLISIGAKADVAQSVADIVNQVTFKGAGVDTPVSSIEAACVQDADRLDAIGAIGVARAFAYGGSKGRLLFNPEDAPGLHADFESYKSNQGATINHFFEKLLLLKDRMQTATGRALAADRHDFMQQFLFAFFEEWGISRMWGSEK